MSQPTRLKELGQGVTTLVDSAFREEAKAPIVVDDYVRDFSREVDLSAMHALLDETMNRHARADRARSDAWLGPRLHHALRLSRREAARRGPWLFLAIAGRPDYVVWRWTGYAEDPIEPAAPERFAGPDYKHALARLWWMAEVFRDGKDYSPAVKALSNQDVVNNLFRMDIAHHRPTVLAAVEVLFPENGVPLSGREANALAKAANAAATTLQFDVLAEDPGLDEAATHSWIEGAKDVDPLAYLDELPPGPDDPPADSDQVTQMTTLLRSLLDEAPVRGRASDTPDDMEATSGEAVEGAA